MLQLLVPLAFLLPQEPVEAQAKPDASESFVKACKALDLGKGYKFQLKVASSGGRGGDEAAEPPPPIQGKFQKNKPLHLKQGEVEAFREGDKFAYRTGEGEWQTMNRGGMRGGFDPSLRAVFGLRSAPAPHKFFDGVGEKVADVKMEKGEVGLIFSGKLLPETVETLSGMSFWRRGGGGRDGGGGPQMEHSGTFAAVFDAKGSLQMLVLKTTTAGSFGEREFERKRNYEVKISGIGDAEVVVSDAAAKKLAENPYEGEEF